MPRKPKGEIRKDLLNEYDTLGKPGAGKTLQEVIQDVEDLMSKNLEFTVEKEGKSLYLVCGEKKVALTDKNWKQQVFKESATGIPYLTTGKATMRCIRFFHDQPDTEDADLPSKQTKQPQPLTPVQPSLPGGSVVQFPITLTT